MTSDTTETVLPPRDAEALARVGRLLASGTAPLRLETESGEAVTLPDELTQALRTVVEAMYHGQAVTVASQAMRLTTQQAADVLGVSRPTLVKLLDEGRIPYETPNRHRRIRLADVLTFQATRRSERRGGLDELSRDAQDLGLYDEDPGAYQAALAEARQKFA